MGKQTDSEGFKELDKLLEQAIALEGAARRSFVKQVPEPQRAQLEALLGHSDAVTAGGIAADVQSVISSQVEKPSTNGEQEALPSIGRWQLHRELGTGGMGQVFYATRRATTSDGSDAGSGRGDYVQEAAIKILWSKRTNTELGARFVRERRILASLNHPGLARFIDGGFLDDGRPWFAMEFVEGESIDQYAAALPLEARLRLFVEVCSSVAYAHQRLIVHRDIKPQNVLVDQAGHPRLLDFGIASVLDDVDDGIRTQSSGTPMTLQYASPEQVGAGLVTVASDIYQLGLLLYKLLTNTVPYDLSDTSLKEAVTTICEQDPSRPGVHNSKVTADLDAIVATALHKDPDRRYRTVTAFADDLLRFLDGHPVRAMPQTRWYVARRFLRRHAVVASVIGASIVALSVATVISVRMADEASEQASRSLRTQQILTDVFQKADPFAGQGAEVTLADALLRAQPDIQARVAEDPLLSIEVHTTLGQIYESLGLVEQEAAAYEALLAAANAMGKSGSRYQLTGIAGVGSVLARTNPVDAVRYFDANLPARPRFDDELDAWLSAQYSFVGALIRVRDYDRADAGTFAMAAVMDEYGVADARKRGRLSQLLASAARRAGDLDVENRHWEDTVAFMREANNLSALAVTLNNWAMHLGRQGRYDESESAFLESMSIFEDAGLNDPTFANVMRSYAGLLFRTGRTNEAIKTAERSLALLEPTSQFYARFVGEQNLVRYTFVEGDSEKALETLVRSLLAARENFADDPSVAQRLLPSFAKLMVFGFAYTHAASALGREVQACSSEPQLLQIIEQLEHPDDRESRDAIWNALQDLETRRVGSLRQQDVNEFAEFYAANAPVFFDALDQLRVLDRLASLPAPVILPSEMSRRHAELQAERLRARQLIATQYRSEIDSIGAYFGDTAVDDFSCP